MHNDETFADRDLLLSHLCGFVLDPAVFIRRGEIFWVDGTTLLVRSPEGDVRSHHGKSSERIPGELVGGYRSIDRAEDCSICNPR